jgi:hypothetical protein
VPAQTYAALDGASSKGRAFHRLIRDQYPYKRTG